MMYTHNCGELRVKDANKKVSLCGWVHSRRDHGGIIFIDLRDRYGITQLVFDPSFSKKAYESAQQLRREYVVKVNGIVKKRKKGTVNKKIATGTIEVFVEDIFVLNKSAIPPIEIDDRIVANEDIRLKYRYLDLRRPIMQHNLIIRHKIVKAIRDFFDKEGFIEIETPILAKSTPEGARDYLVPSRIHPGKFYALPQSPQLFKQLLMIAGFGKYFQIAKCFRDEDLRADRQPEFTQIDVEMSFITEEDIFEVHERLMQYIWKKVLNLDLKIPFKRISYKEAMERFGTDTPDMRFGMELVDVTDIVKKSEFNIFINNIKKGGVVKGINVNAKLSKKELQELLEFVKVYEAEGLAWMYVKDKLEGPISKFFSLEIQKKLIKRMKAKNGDTLLFISDKKSVVNNALGNLRIYLAKKLNLIPKGYDFVWIVDFPLVEYDEEEQRYVAVHHPFTSPKEEDIKYLDKEPEKVRARAYDLTLNGVEIGGGSIRIHTRELQEKMFKALNISEIEAQEKFGFLLEALSYGAPPHGGIAFGLDRLVALIIGSSSIREVIAFPKTKDAQSLMEGSPSEVNEEQLKELHIKVDIIKRSNIVFQRILDALNKEKVEYEVIEHKPVYTCKEAAMIRGTKLSQGCKALICETSKGVVQAVIPGDKELDIEKLKKLLNGEVKLATPKLIKELIGCDIGAVPPFANLFGIKVLIDKDVLKNEIIAFNAGMHTKSIKMRSSDLVKLTGAKIESLSK